MRLLACTLAAMALTGGQALAHAQLVRADPKVGSSISAPPARLWLRFNEVVRLKGSGVQLVTPDGRTVLLEPLSQDPKDPRAVLAPAPANLAPGRYEVRWRALSPDAHRTQGDFSFTIGH
jgi:methionine-rich copper-binding protein CopC